MNREEFAKKIVEVIQAKGKEAVELIKDLDIAEATVACHYILVGSYSEAREHALLHEIYDAIYFTFKANLGAPELSLRLGKIEEIYRVKPNYDEILEVIVGYLK